MLFDGAVTAQSTSTVSVGGQLTRLIDRGAGDPVVVLHGWGGRVESMAPILRCLEGRFRTVALDLPGFGEAPLPTAVWGTPDHAEFVADALRLAGIQRAHFIGHSFGAKTALYLAATHSELVDHLVLVGSNGVRLPPSAAQRLKSTVARAARIAGRVGTPGRKLRDAIYRRIASDDYRDAGPLRPMLVRTVNEDFSHLLPLVKSPTLLVWGDRDTAVPLAVGRAMEAGIPDAGLVVFEEAGHFCYIDQAERFCRVVRHFLTAA
jgi:pimeloyl-ACP methyl ester carboxylesterase